MELVKLRIAFHQAQCGPEQYPPQPLASTLAEFGSSFMLAGIVIRNNGKPRILLDLAGIGKPTDITNFREETGNRELTNPFDSEHFLRIRHFSKDTGNQLVNLMQLLFSNLIYIQQLPETDPGGLAGLFGSNAALRGVYQGLRPLDSRAFLLCMAEDKWLW